MVIKGDKPSFFKTFSYGNFSWVFSYFIPAVVAWMLPHWGFYWFFPWYIGSLCLCQQTQPFGSILDTFWVQEKHTNFASLFVSHTDILHFLTFNCNLHSTLVQRYRLHWSNLISDYNIDLLHWGPLIRRVANLCHSPVFQLIRSSRGSCRPSEGSLRPCANFFVSFFLPSYVAFSRPCSLLEFYPNRPLNLIDMTLTMNLTLNLINLMKKITDDNTWVPFGLLFPICLSVNCTSCKS